MPNNIPGLSPGSLLSPTFATGMEPMVRITPKKLFLNIKQRDTFRA